MIDDDFTEVAIQPAGLGHNSPPSPVPGLLSRTDELLAAGRDLPEIKTDDDMKAVTNFAAMCADHLAKIEAARTEAKAPFLKGGRDVDDAYKALSTPLEILMDAMRASGGKYMREHPGVVRTQEGASASARSTWIATITDRSKLNLKVIAPFLDDAALQKAVNNYMKAYIERVKTGKAKVAGVTFAEQTAATYRR